MEDELKAMIFKLNDMRSKAEKQMNDPVMHWFSKGQFETLGIVIRMLEAIINK